jgi:hypothetical protein
LQPDYVVGREGDELVLRNFEGHEFRYPDPVEDEPATGAAPAGASPAICGFQPPSSASSKGHSTVIEAS